MKIKDSEIKILANLMLEYSKQNGFPFYEKIANLNETNKVIFSNIDKIDYYNLLIWEYLTMKIIEHSNTKMGKLVKNKFEKNKELFLEFVHLNIKKEFDLNFNKVWEKIRNILSEIEEELFKSIENSQYKDFSWWLFKKYESYIKSIFPYINNVWVKIRKLED